MIRAIHARLQALELSVIVGAIRLPTLADFYAGRDNDGDVALNGEIIKLPPGAVTWRLFYGDEPHIEVQKAA